MHQHEHIVSVLTQYIRALLPDGAPLLLQVIFIITPPVSPQYLMRVKRISKAGE